MKFKQLSVAFFSILFVACSNESESNEQKVIFKNRGHQLVAEMIDEVGNLKMLKEKNDVVYTYTYETPDGKIDVSTEKYLFEGELSYGYYERHDRTFPQLEGAIEQGYDGQEYWLKNDGKVLTDSALLASVAFKRPTNFYWFAMFQKLLSPGVNYEHLGEQTIDDQQYDIVNITYDSKNDKPTDIYRLFINQETHLVDQFLFTVADYGKMEKPFLMKLEYEKIDQFLIPTKRKYKASSWKAEVNEDPWILVNWSDITFNNGLTEKDFQK